MDTSSSNNVRDIAAKLINARRVELAKSAAAIIGPPPTSVDVGTDKTMAAWNLRGPAFQNPAQDQVSAQALYDAGHSQDDVADLMFPQRRRLMQLGRPDLVDQVRFAEDMAKRDTENRVQLAEHVGAPLGSAVPPPPPGLAHLVAPVGPPAAAPTPSPSPSPDAALPAAAMTPPPEEPQWPTT